MFGIVLGTKIGQSQQFTQDGIRIPVTQIQTSPCYVLGVRRLDDGRSMMMLGFGSAKKNNKAQETLLTKLNITTPLRYFREYILPESATIDSNDSLSTITIGDKTITVGEQLKPETMFQIGDHVDVAGTSKGKGFQGGVKRHGFGGGPRTHGQSDRERAPGSIGAGTDPGRVHKGKKMAGRMGAERVTVKNLPVVSITESELLVRGLVPGAKNGLLEIYLFTNAPTND